MPNIPVTAAAPGSPSGHSLHFGVRRTSQPTTANPSIAPDPYIMLSANYHRLDAIIDDGNTEEHDRVAAMAAWSDNDDALIATRATTSAGAAAGLRVALEEFRTFYASTDPDQGDLLIMALIESGIGVLAGLTDQR